MRRLPLAIVLSAAAWAQSIVAPGAIPRAMSRFEPRPDDRPLACAVTPFGPALNFSFRMQAGYVVRVPMSQYFGPRHVWFIVVRLTPEGGDGKPVFLASRVRLPDVPRTKMEVEIGGGYLLGEGSYQARWMMLDDQGRVCRKEWRIESRLRKAESKARVAMSPYSVAAFSLTGSDAGSRARDDAAPFSVTILMHAAPLFPRRTHFRATDRMLLLGSLAALLERLPARSVRLVVFNLDQQKELYRRDGFTLAAMDQIGQAMNDLELNAVDYHVLQNPRGHVDLLADLVNREIRASPPSGAVLFFGPAARFEDKPPRAALERQAAVPRFFYFEYRPFFRRAGPVLPDSISLTVAELKGRTLIIRNPAEFANAIDQIERLATARP
ncbi:MAG TPA: hypothetical protein VGS58_21595 [Candidatus Sulfopaludibacter sp.]|nr:hypothetical protein [Candidatus Sulfopaludibacter sp.]